MKINKNFIFAIIALMFSTLCFSQKGKPNKNLQEDLEYYNLCFSTFEKKMLEKQINNSFSGESYIYLAKGNYLLFDHNKDHIKEIEKSRILLQDVKAIESFSEFYFNKDGSHWMTIEKKDGKKTKVDIQSAIPVTTEVPMRFRGRFSSSESFKLAIPGLEVGDIIDYTTVNSDRIYRYQASSIATLSQSVPILKSIFVIDVNNDVDFTANTFNITEKFTKKDGGGLNRKGEKSEDFDRYYLESGNLKGEEDFPFFNAYQYLPIVKYNLFAPSHFAFSKPTKKIKNNLDITELLQAIFQAKNVNREVFYDFSSKVFKIIKEDKEKKKPIEQVTDRAYYEFRELLVQYSHPVEFVNQSRSYALEYDKLKLYPYAEFNEQIFLFTFADILKRLELKSEVVAIVPASIGGVKNLVTNDEVIYGIYVPSFKKYYWVPSINKDINDLPQSLSSGGEGVSFDIEAKWSEAVKGKTFQFPPSSPENHYEVTSINAKIIENNEISFERTDEYYGYRKYRHFDLFEEFPKYLYTDYLAVYPDTKPYKNDLETLKESLEDKKKTYVSFDETSLNNQKAAFEKFIEEEKQKNKFISYELLGTGRFKNSGLKLKVNYTSPDRVKKIGNNLAVDIGGLIGSQLVIEDKYKSNREYDVYLGGPRKLINNIVFNIPTGYKVEDVTSLNKNIENEFVSFKSEAKIESNSIVIKTAKEYKKSFFGKENWSPFINMMNEAYNFTQEKVILKKI